MTTISTINRTFQVIEGTIEIWSQIVHQADRGGFIEVTEKIMSFPTGEIVNSQESILLNTKHIISFKTKN